MTAGGSAFVIDASIALSWCFEDEASPVTDAVLQRLRHARAIAPAIWPLELANGLRSAERRGRIDEASVPAATQLLTALPQLARAAVAAGVELLEEFQDR